MTAPTPEPKDTPPATAAGSAASTAGHAPPQERLVVTEHRLEVGKTTLEYTAT